jgi:hypothetical protein
VPVLIKVSHRVDRRDNPDILYIVLNSERVVNYPILELCYVHGTIEE